MINDVNVRAYTMDRLDAIACGMFDKRVTYKSLAR